MRGEASPFSTGGGGVTFERAVTTIALGSLLLNETFPGLGSGFRVKSVRLQSAAVGPVDDIVILGDADSGFERTLSIACRVSPEFRQSDSDTEALLGSLLTDLREDLAGYRDGQRRLAIAFAGMPEKRREVALLASVASATSTVLDFKQSVARQSDSVKRRFARLETMLRNHDPNVTDEETYQLLSATDFLSFGVMDADSSDWVRCEQSLARICEEPAKLLDGLYRFSANLSPLAGSMHEPKLRTAMLGVARIGSSPRFKSAVEILERSTNEAVVHLTRGFLDGESSFEVERVPVRAKIENAIRELQSDGGCQILSGAPGAGKSFAVARALELSRQADPATTCVLVDLHELPRTMLEIEATLSCDFSSALAGLPGDSRRLLVLDGADTSGASDGLVASLVTAARDVGFGILLPVRSEAVNSVSAALASILKQAPDVVSISGFSDEEVHRLVQRLPDLAVFANGHLREVLRQPSLVRELLLEQGIVEYDQSGGRSQLLQGLWARRVADPSDRISPERCTQVLLDLGRQALTGEQLTSTDPDTVSALRSAGVLRTLTDGLPWKQSLAFDSDFWRDLSGAAAISADRSLIAELNRQELAVVRLGIEFCLAAGEVTLAELITQLGDKAEELGARWRDLPLEAVLALPDSDVWGRLWPDIEKNGFELLFEIAEVADRRAAGFSEYGIWRGLTQMILRIVDDLPGLAVNNCDRLSALLLLWLEGSAVHSEEAIDARTRVVEFVSEHVPEQRVLALALLCEDMTSEAEAELRELANNRPSSLSSVIETVSAGYGLARASPELLAHLMERYYVAEPEWYWRGSGLSPTKYQGPMGFDAAWWLTPLWLLLDRRPDLGLSTFTTLMAHAERSLDVSDTFDLVMPNGEVCQFPETSLPWRWASVVVPRHCTETSLCLAVERFAETYVREGVEPTELATQLLRREPFTLSSVAIAAGLLLRNSQAGPQLDWVLRNPNLWDMDMRRLVDEISPSFGRLDRAELKHEGSRGLSFFDFAAAVAAGAALESDQDRIVELKAMGELLADHGDAGMLRCAQLNPEFYEIREFDQGIGFEFTPPASVVAQQRELSQDSGGPTRFYDIERRSAIAAAEDLPGLLQEVMPEFSASGEAQLQGAEAHAVATLARRVLTLAGDGDFRISGNELAWCIDMIQVGFSDKEWLGALHQYYEFGANRGAAWFGGFASHPLVAAGHEFGIEDLVSIATAVADLGDHELGEAFLDGLIRAAAAPCGETCQSDSSCARHRIIEAQAAAFSTAIERPSFAVRCIDLLTYHNARQIPSLESVGASAVASVERNPAFLGEYDTNLPLSCRGSTRGRVVLTMLSDDFRDAFDSLVAPIESVDQDAFGRLLRSMRLCLSELDDPQPLIKIFMRLADEFLEREFRHEFSSDITSELLPAPAYNAMAREPQSDFIVACSRWPSIDELSPTFDRWLESATGCGHCANALVPLIQVHDLDWQINEGSTLLLQVLGEGDAGYCHLVGARLLDIVTDSADRSTIRVSTPFVQLLDRLASARVQDAITAQDLLEAP